MKKITKLVLVVLLGIATISCNDDDEQVVTDNNEQKVENSDNNSQDQNEDNTNNNSNTNEDNVSNNSNTNEGSNTNNNNSNTNEESNKDILDYINKNIVLSEDKKTLISYPENVKLFVIPESVTVIGENVFRDNRDLEEFSFDGLTEIGAVAFYGTYLKNVDLPEGLTKIGQSAFKTCYKLESITIPSTVTTIENFAFCICPKLTKIVMKAPFSIGKMLFDYFDGSSEPVTLYVNEYDYDSYVEYFYNEKNLIIEKL